MDHVRVSEMLGSPSRRQRDELREAWEYCWDNVGMDDYLVAWFRDGRLESWTQSQDFDLGECDKQFEAFTWPEEPAQG